jgi:hypothetical protein
VAKLHLLYLPMRDSNGLFRGLDTGCSVIKSEHRSKGMKSGDGEALVVAKQEHPANS